MQPLKKVSRKQQQKRLKMAEQILRSLLQTRAPRASAGNKLAEVANHQISLSKAAKTFKTHGPDFIVVLSADATPLWKPSATRCDISVHCWQQPSDAGAPNLWPNWWAMWGGDDTQFMLAMETAHDLNGQVQDLCHNCDIVWEGKTLGFKCVITGDGKNMHAGNPSSKSKCWICEEDNGLAFFVGDMKGGLRCCAYLRCIPTAGRVSDYVHATCRILCILVKRLRGEFHQRGIHVGVRELDGEMHEIKELCKGIPEAERIAPRRAKEGSFDLTSANAFMANPQWADNIVTIAKARTGNVETPAGPLVWVVLRTLLHHFAHIHRFWRQKEFFIDSDVAMYTNAVDRFREAWEDLGWKVSMWVHWTYAHSPYFAEAYRNIYTFSSIPSEKRNSPFKRDLHNSCKGWALLKPRLSRLSMGHVVNMNNLDMGLLARKVQDAEGRDKAEIPLGRRRVR